MQTVILAIDIETTGPNFVKNGIISIGYCAGYLDGNVILKNRISLDISCKEFDSNCENNFWKEHQALLKTLKKESVGIIKGLTKFISDIDDLDSKYNLIIISDFPLYDIGFINYYLAQYINRAPLQHKFGDTKNYRPIYDTDGYSRGLLHLKYDSVWVYDSDVSNLLGFQIDKNLYTHLPDEDAYYIYRFHTNVIAKV
jgi:hypothetical protein